MAIDKAYFEQRAKERSTWLGVIGFFSAIGVSFSPEFTQTIVNVGVALSGLVFAATQDKPD